MAISFVGSATQGVPSGDQETGRVEVPLPAGMAEGDIVVAICCADTVNQTPSPDDGTSDYATITVNTAVGVDYGAFYKFMGSSPDSSIFLPPWHTITFPTSWVVAVFRGVDTSSPFDVSLTEATGTSGDPDPPSITTVTDGAAVVSCGFLDDDNITSCTQSGATDVVFVAAGGSSTLTSSTMLGWQLQATADTVDPAAFVTDGDDAWSAITLALREAGAGGGALVRTIGDGLISGLLLNRPSLVRVG